MRTLLCFVLSGLSSLAGFTQIEYNLYFNGEINDWISLAEIKDSGFVRSIVMERKKNWEVWDTARVYEFDNGGVIRETGYREGKIIWDSRTVTEDGKKKVYIKDTYPDLDPVSIVEEYDSTGRLCFAGEYSKMGKILSFREYDYDQKRLICERRYITGYDTVSMLSFYDEQNNLIKTVEHSFRYQVTDSILIHIRYDERKNIIFYCQRPSPTYMKNMQKWCATGLVNTYRIEYDSLGRIRKKALDFDTLVHIDQSKKYFIYEYGEGLIRRTFHDDGETEYYFQSHKRIGDFLFIAENNRSMRIAYLSENSELPKRIDFLSDFESSNYRIYWER